MEFWGQFIQLIDFSILLFLMGKKSNKRTQPRDAESSLIHWFPWRGQKLAANVACRGEDADFAYRNRQVHWHLSAQTVCPRDPRKPSDQGRIAMGKTPSERFLLFALWVPS
ncbi:MAG: hypothetical protein WAX48_01065 [Desulfosalsimonadaceae bacterium]